MCIIIPRNVFRKMRYEFSSTNNVIINNVPQKILIFEMFETALQQPIFPINDNNGTNQINSKELISFLDHTHIFKNLFYDLCLV